MTDPAPRLIACLHDVSPKHFERVIEIDDFYREIGIGSRYAMLVVPDFDGQYELSDHPEFIRWLRDRAKSGVEIFLHGYYHQDFTPTAARPWLLRLQYQLLGEGEFAVIGVQEASERLNLGRRLLENILEMEVNAFVAPAWQYSKGARFALAQADFRIAEDRASVWDPTTGLILSRTPVIAYSARSSVRRDLSIGWSRIATRVLKNAQLIRHALHPADFSSDKLISEIKRSLSELLAYREVVTYRSLNHRLCVN